MKTTKMMNNSNIVVIIDGTIVDGTIVDIVDGTIVDIYIYIIDMEL